MLRTTLRLGPKTRRTPKATPRARHNPFPNVLERFEDRIVPTFGVSGLLSPTAADCDPVTAVSAGPRLVGVDTAQSALLNGLLTGLAGPGSQVALSAVDYNALSTGDVNLNALLTGLQGKLGVATPEQALATNVTLNQLLSAAAAAARADGNTALVTALNKALVPLGPLTGAIKLGDLLKVDLPTGSLARADVNALDLLAGGVQLFNFKNVATTTSPVTVSGANLGPLGSVLNAVAVQAQVVEPPVFVIGTAGTQFYSAAVRLKLNVDLADLSLDTASLLAPIRNVLDPTGLLGVNVTAAAVVGQVQLFADVARGSGTIQSVDVLTNAVTLRATPSVADLYLGTVSDGLFFNRTRDVTAADVTPGTVGSLTISANIRGVPLPISGLVPSLGVTLRAVAEGTDGTPSNVTFNPPYPKSATVGSSAAAVGNLVTSLLGSLELGLTGNLGVLNGLLNTITGALDPLAGTALGPVLPQLLSGVADPALDALGVGIGEMDLTVYGADSPDPAVAVNDSVITLAGRPVRAFVLANDAFPNDCPQTLAVASAPVNGTVVVNADKTITYTPADGFLGADRFTYSLTDEHGRVTTATVTVKVGTGGGTNRPPVANPDAVTTPAGTAVTVAVLTNDSDPDGDALSVIGVSGPAHGSASVAADGSVRYTPDAGFVGVDTFVYAAGDGKGGVGSATVTVIVGSGKRDDRDPVANPDAATTLRGRLVAVPVLANDTDPDGDPLTIVGLGQAANGTVALKADGTVNYTPAAGFTGTDRFAYTISDGRGGTAGATVTITVTAPTPANRPPVANPDAATAAAGKVVAVAVLGNDADPDGDRLSVSAVSTPGHGTAKVNANGTVSYTPAAGFVGTDTFTYTASDGRGGTATATVTVQVRDGGTGANRDPVANPDTASTPGGTLVSVSVLANDSDPDGNPLAVVSVGAPGHGTAKVNADGTVSYTPAAGFTGTDVFFYTVSDGKGGSGTAAVTVRVTGGGSTNRDPSANPDSATTTAGKAVTVPVLANDSDPDGNPLTVTSVSTPGHGTAKVNADGTVSYTPAAGYTGTDTFSYVVSDGKGGAGTATVTVRVDAGTPPPDDGGNKSPAANPDLVSTPKDQAATISVLANDGDPDGDALTVTAVTPPANGTVTVNADGSVRYTPRAGFVGTDAFTYTASDGEGGTDTAVVTVRVGLGGTDNGGGGTDNNSGTPSVRPDSAFTEPGVAVTVPVLDNDTDVNGGRLSIASVTQPANGTVTVNPDGTITYTPAAGFRGVDTFTYTAGNGRGGVGTAAVQIVVGQNGPGPVLPQVRMYVVGADTLGGPRVTAYNPDGSVRFNFFAYDPDGRFGVVPVTADIDGDGLPDIITAPGLGGGPHIRVLSGSDLSPIAEFFAFDPAFRGGCLMSVADLNGDGVQDLIVSAGEGGGPRVIAVDGTRLRETQADGQIAPGALLASFFAFDPAAAGGGVSVAVTDRDGDGVPEIVTGCGPGGPPVVRVWDARTLAMVSEFTPFAAGVDGVSVGGRGRYLMVGPGGQAEPQVMVYSGTDTTTPATTGTAYEETFTGGCRVNVADTVDPNAALFLVGAGVGGGPRIKVLTPDLDSVLPDYFAFEDTFRGGVHVA